MPPAATDAFPQPARAVRLALAAVVVVVGFGLWWASLDHFLYRLGVPDEPPAVAAGD
jgi:hypothetical protein